jgi:RNA polymerase sigma-70 factor (ECF subfamily)
VTALQVLPARQRAVLILREVLGYHTDEVADLLGSTVESVTSAPKRARATLQRHLPPTGGRAPAPAPDSAAEQAVVARFVRAYDSGHIDALVDLLTADVCISMPPIPSNAHGRDVAVRFLAAVSRQKRRYDLVPTRANGQMAFGVYLRPPTDGVRHATGVDVVTLTGDRIGAFTASTPACSRRSGGHDRSPADSSDIADPERVSVRTRSDWPTDGGKRRPVSPNTGGERP